MAETIDELVHRQFRILRNMVLQNEAFMLRREYIHSEAFIIGSSKNIRDAIDLVHETVKVAIHR